MDIDNIIAALRTRCPSFATRVAGAAQFKMLPEAAAMAVPCAFVLPLDDSPDPPASPNMVRQYLEEGFAVVVAIDNTVDERGQAGSHTVQSLRAELWRALLGWQPTAQHNGIGYGGGHLLQVDRARLWFQFEFSAGFEIGPEDGWQEGYVASLPPLTTVSVQVDVIDPIADRNVQYPGPDGRIEQAGQIDLPA